MAPDEEGKNFGPDNRTAPDWANWKAQDENGRWYWYASKPKQVGCFWIDFVGPFKYAEKWTRSAGDDWRDTLQPVCRYGGDPALTAEKKKGTPRIDVIGQNGNDGEHYEEAGEYPSPRQVAVEIGYDELADILIAALEQAQSGKGAERHADGRAFRDQPMQRIADVSGPGFITGQVSKKHQEALGMLERGEYAAVERELLGAVVYAAGLLVWARRHEKTEENER